MAKKKIIRKSNRILNKYLNGGGFNLDTIGNIGTSLTSIINSGIQNAQLADTSELDNIINAAKTYQVNAVDNDSLMDEWSSFSPLENISWRDIRGGSTGQRLTNTFSSIGSGAMGGASVGGPIGAIVGGAVGLGSSLAGWITGNRKAKKQAKKFNNQIEAANAKNLTALEDKASYIDTQNDLNILANYSANGGPITMRYTGLMSPFGNRFDDGGKIYIKPENRGKFTALKKRTGKSATWFKEHGTPAQKKMATFALNAKKWKHENGGNLNTLIPNIGQHGGNFSNGVFIIDNGGTHEENPYEGVQLGVDTKGIPNLVEEGEVIWNDYVFSNRLKPTKEMKKKNKYRGNTFAEVAKYLQKESEERPNDPISKRGLDATMNRLALLQEGIRNTEDNKSNKFAKGGFKNLTEDNYLPTIDTIDYSIPDTIEQLPIRGYTSTYNNGSNNSNKSWSWLRYAPVVGSAIGLSNDLFSKPDYTGPDTIIEAANQLGNYTPIEYNPIGNYLQYKPLDRNYYINKLNAQSGATRRAILNTTSPSRNAALLAADYNALGRLGDLARQAEEYNLAQRERVEGFNRQTNMANSEMGLKAAMANQEAALKAKSQRLSGVAQAMAMRDTIDSRRGASISANLTNLFDSLGNIGKEEFAKDMIENSPFLLYNWAGKYKGKKSKGGYLTIKKKGK